MLRKRFLNRCPIRGTGLQRLILLVAFALLAAFALSLAPGRLCAAPVALQSHVIPGDQDVVQVRLPAGKPADLDARQCDAALRHAVALWNSATGGHPHLALTPASAAPPVGRLCIQFEFSSDPIIFAKMGADGDFANAYTQVDTAKNIAVTTIALNNTTDFNAHEAFSTDGHPTIFYDLELVALHELGHALGLGHAPASSHIPPIMSAHIGSNNEIHRATGADIASLRRLFPEDIAMLHAALEKRKSTRLVGSYTGTTVVTKGDPDGIIQPGHRSTVPKGQFTITDDNGVLKLNFNGNTGEAPATAILAGLPIEFTQISGAYLRKASVVSMNDVAIKVHVVVKPLVHEIEQDLYLRRD